MSSSTDSTSEQYEGGGGSVGGFEGGSPDHSCIAAAQEMYTVIQETRNHENPYEYDFTDPETGLVREYFDSMTNQEKLDQIKEVIARLRNYKKTVDLANEIPHDDRPQPEIDVISDDVVPDDEPAGSEFVIWEPRGCLQKIQNLLWNMMEVQLVIFLGVVAYCHPSLNALTYFWGYLLLLWPMTKDLKVRYKWNIGVLVLLLIGECVLVFQKRKKASFADATQNTEFQTKQEFYEATKKLLELGYSFHYNPDIVHHSGWSKVNKPYIIHGYNKFLSFDMEIIAALLNIAMICFSFVQDRRIARLQTIKRGKFLDFVRLRDPEEDDEVPVDEEIQIGAHSKGRNYHDRKKEERLKEEKKARDQAYLAELKKEIKINLIGSERFYNYNRLFFVAGLLLKLLESVTFNSFSCVPGLLLVLVLFAAYDLRKKYSRLYRTFSFVVMYWIRFMMAVKISAEIYMNIPTVNAHLHHERQNREHWESTFLQVLFGELHTLDEKESNLTVGLVYLYQFFAFFGAFYCMQGWVTCKWLEIRDKTRMTEHHYSVFYRFAQYIKVREQEDNDESALVQMLAENSDKKKIKAALEEAERKQRALKGKYDSGNASKKAKSHNSYLGQIVLFSAQVAMFILAYGYHSSAGFFHLCWLVLSFILSTKNTLFLSVVVMIPILTWEFIFIYMSKVPRIRETTFFMMFGKYYRFEMWNPTLEQFFMLVTLLLFYMMISSYIKRIDNKPAENGLVRFFRIRIHAKRVAWIWVFFLCRYVHVIILIYLFQRGVRNLDCLNNLGYMIFFVVFTAYESVYRKAGALLLFFTAAFIILQYFFSLFYQVYMVPGNEEQIEGLYWWNVFPHEYRVGTDPYKDPFHIEPGESIYFRSSPHLQDWLNIFLMRFLREVNIIYTTERISEYKLRQEATHILEEKSGKVGYYWQRVRRIVTGLFNYVVIIALVAVQAITQPSLITWFFFGLNLTNLGYMIKGTRHSRELKIQYHISSTIRFFALIVIIANILILAVGHRIDNPNDPLMVSIKHWLQIIGLKANEIDFVDFEKKGHDLTRKERQRIEHDALQGRMLAMIIFFLLSIYLCNHFAGKIRLAKEDENFDESDYKKLFEYRINRKDAQADSDSGSEAEKITDADQLQESIFKKRKFYTQIDLIDFYEGVRFTLPFMTYRNIRWWNTCDILARYGNLFATGIYIFVTFYQEVNAFSCLNLFLLGTYFFKVTRRVGTRADQIQKATGVQSQCDVQMARLVTKRFKKEAFYEFLQARKKTWNRLFGTLMLLALLAYPTPILAKVRKMGLTKEQVGDLDKFHLFLFYMGIQFGKRDELVIGLLLLGLTVERIAINWLDNRFGCTHFKLQKFAELDERRRAIRYDWDVPNPKYDVEQYRSHYFRNDFEEIKTLVTHKTFQEILDKDDDAGLVDGEVNPGAKAQHFRENLYGDFVPIKIGQRVLETVRFTVQLNSEAKVLNMDDETKRIIHEKNYDYESVPVLRKYKIEALRQILKENVDRKYKISYYKGCQLYLESLIIFLLMISLVMKANFWSGIYLLFIFKYACTRNKTNLMVRICSYLSVSLFLQYTLFLLNLTAGSSPQRFPNVGDPSLRNYPLGFMTGNEPDYILPVFFHLRVFRDNLMLSYMLGVGIDVQQVWSLTFDFVNIFLMTMYIFEFRNPILSKHLKKVFWQFPTKDDKEQWARLDKTVQKQVDWLFNPKPLFRDGSAATDVHPSFREVLEELTPEQCTLAEAQLQFAHEYQQENEFDLNYTLTNYVDMKYQAIWGEELLKEKKGEIKANCIYFRLVKQGSQLVYISFHIVTMFVVLLMAAMRQSVFGLIYVILLLPRMKDGAEVLKQRDIQQGKELDDLKHKIEDEQDVLKQAEVRKTIIQILREKLGLDEEVNMAKAYKHEMKQLDHFLQMNTDELENYDRHMMMEYGKDLKAYQIHTSMVLLARKVDPKDCELLLLHLVKKNRRMSGDQIQEHKDKLEELRKQRYLLEKNFQKKNAQLKKSDRDKIASQQWPMIGIIQRWLLSYAILDLTVQILYQMPLFLPPNMEKLRFFGLRKVWRYNHGPGFEHLGLGDLTYAEFINCDPWTEECPHFKLDWRAFYFEVMICFIASIIMLQSEIFSSAGYLKYVTQHNGSLDLLMQLAEVKAKATTYVKNNYKIRKILSIQRKRESILKTVDKLKDKITRWRQFTRTTLVNTRAPSTFTEQDEKAAVQDEKQQPQKTVQQKEEESSPSKAEKDLSPTDKRLQWTKDEVMGDDEEEDEDDDEEDELLQMHKAKNKVRISPEERENLLLKLSQDFAKAKLGKQRICVRLYLLLQDLLCDKIMFKNERHELEQLKGDLAAGSLEVPTELQAMMTVESKELIKDYYDNLEGQDNLFKLMKTNRDKGASLLSLTKFDSKIKLNQMKMTWEYTRTLPLMLHFVETFFYILISQSQSIIYFAMIFSMYENAGIISLIYPIAVFGWALLEERRPGRTFWRIIRIYTEIILFFKFILNLDLFSGYLDSPQFIEINQTFKFGIYDFRSLGSLILYMMPEILILCFLMLHEIKLKLMGLYDKDEEDIEPVLDGIQRNILKGDEEAVKAKKLETQNMCMERYFESAQEQTQRMEEFVFMEKEHIRADLEKSTAHEIQKNEDYKHITRGKYSLSQLKGAECIDKLVDFEFGQKYPSDANLLAKHNHLIADISASIFKTSCRFDIDSTGASTMNDELIREKVIQKTLDKDSLIFVEGLRPREQPKFMTRTEFKMEAAKPENWDLFSAGDFKEDFAEKFETQDERVLNQPGWFEHSKYFDRIFPGLKIQKPGYDLYGTTTSILGVMGAYIFMYYEEYSFTQNFFDFAKGQTVVFSGEMAITILLVIAVMIIERYANRTNTKKVEEKKINEFQVEQKQSFFSNDEMFKRTTTQRSMTVKLKTVKTADLDMSSSAAQDFLHSFETDNKSDGMDDSRTKITTQQKTKFFLHWFMLIFGHLYCFWFIPIKGNMQLYGTASCDEAQKGYYRCYNFKENGYLRGLYILLVLYLMVSAYQISLGFPLLKRASSVMQYYNDLGNVLGQIYINLPFIAEIRCLLDFTFSKTSLDIFQFFQLFNYHFDMYLYWVGNRWYTIKDLGIQVECAEKCIFGILIASVVLFLLIGPFYIFSSISPWVAHNAVLDGRVNLAWQINKTIGVWPEKGLVVENPDVLNSSFKNITSSLQYEIYHLENPYLKTLNNETWAQNEFSQKTETRDFSPEQVQYCVMRRHSDRVMQLSVMAGNDLRDDVLEKMRHPADLNISLQFDYSFARAQPMTALHAVKKNNRSVDNDYFNDCRFIHELAQFNSFQCGAIRDKSLSFSAILSQAYNPALVLGQNNWITEVGEKQKDPADLLHDVKITFFCDQTWDIVGTLHATQYSKAKSADGGQHGFSKRAMMVDSHTCALKYPDAELDEEGEAFKKKYNMNNEEYFEYQREHGHWTNIILLLFSMKVATGFIAAYTPTTFYLVLVYGSAAAVRKIFVFSTWAGYTYEVTKPEPMMKLCEACYIMRHEENLVGEEECYRMLQEIIRQPQLHKELGGTSLAGSMHPDLDHLTPAERKKLAQLDKLQRKGWDVEPLRQKIIRGDRKIDADDAF